ncbi:hypothetical protein VRC14_11205 [Erwinia aphidicola]
MIAHRTSPTNIGLSLMANLTAMDFGYIPGTEVLRRVTLTLDTLDKMEHYRGHLFNWYDTLTLLPLNPRYVSSVDSGNMAGHLLTLSAGLGQLRHQPIIDIGQMLAGLKDTLAILETCWGAHAPTTLRLLQKHLVDAAQLSPALLQDELKKMRKLSARLEGMSQQENSEVSRWTRLLHAQLTRFCQVWSSLLGWLPPDWRAAGLPSLAWLSRADTLQPDSPPFGHCPGPHAARHHQRAGTAAECARQNGLCLPVQ